MIIKQYDPHHDENLLMKLLENQGDDWVCYWAEAVSAKYRHNLRSSITYVAYEDDVLVGYVRALDDVGFYVYVCDLLVDPAFRGNGIGQALMERIADAYPEQTVYVMSDVDPYYKKLGYVKEGSVFEVIPRTLNQHHHE